MELSDYAYLVFLLIFAIANAIRQRNRKKQEEGNAPLPPQGDVRSEREMRRQNQPRPEPGRELNEEEEDPVRRMLDEMLGRRSTATTKDYEEASAPAPKPARPVQQTRKEAAAARKNMPPTPKLKVAEGYREGEDLAEYARRTRRQSRAKLQPLDTTSSTRRSRKGKRIDFDLRTAVIYDAILRRPYADGKS